MGPYVRYSKPTRDVLVKASQFEQANALELERNAVWATLYKAQPLRSCCKICGHAFEEAAFVTADVSYYLCSGCGHLNGAHEDTVQFAEQLYAGKFSNEYAQGYRDSYVDRVESIYLPKVDFMLQVLAEAGIQAGSDLKVLDFGCGGGHFLKACETRAVHGQGLESNIHLVELANSFLESNSVSLSPFDSWMNEIETSDATVLSLIGVLEHLQFPSDLLDAFGRSSVQFLYISVPLLSTAALIQRAFPQVFPRHLAGGHTHLFTVESLRYMIDRWGFQTMGEWWFGTDMVDIWRSISVTAGLQDGESLDFNDLLWEYFGQYLDDLQAALDRARRCSEVHLLLAKAGQHK